MIHNEHKNVPVIKKATFLQRCIILTKMEIILQEKKKEKNQHENSYLNLAQRSEKISPQKVQTKLEEFLTGFNPRFI